VIKRVELNLKELGELAKIIPGQEPELEISPTLKKMIPVCEPKLDGNELKYVTKCFETSWISSAGENIQKFEEEFAQACGAKYGVSCSSGTAALHLALATLGVGRGDEVIIPTFTMIATANAVTYTGAKPVLVDSEPNTWNINVKKVEEKITHRTKVIMPVHTYGHPADMDKILDIAKKYNLYVVEDAAEAHGSEYQGRKIGGMGDIACFSFYANKIITTGEGGMLTTDNEEMAKIARDLRGHAFSEERHFWHNYIGFNYRMTNLQAAIGLAQMEKFDENVRRRIQNAKLYNSMLKNIKGITLPPQTKGVKNVYWMYSILVNDEFDITRDELRKKLAKRGIETRTFFIPIHLQPIYFRRYNERFPVAEELCRRGMYLPSASTLTKEEIEYVVESIATCAPHVM